MLDCLELGGRLGNFCSKVAALNYVALSLNIWLHSKWTTKRSISRLIRSCPPHRPTVAFLAFGRKVGRLGTTSRDKGRVWKKAGYRNFWRTKPPACSSHRTNLTLTDCQISNGSTIALRTHIETSRNLRSFGQIFLTPIFLPPTSHPSFTSFPVSSPMFSDVWPTPWKTSDT